MKKARKRVENKVVKVILLGQMNKKKQFRKQIEVSLKKQNDYEKVNDDPGGSRIRHRS